MSSLNPMRRSLILMMAASLPAARAIDCSDGDVACIDHACSAFCNAYTCSHPLCPGCGPEVGCPAHSPSPPPPPSPPPQPPWDANLQPGELHVYAVGSKLYANGVRLHIKGVNWFGSEGRSGPPLGLDKHEIAWYMRFLKSHGFNAIRFLFNHETVLANTQLEPPNEAKYGKGAPWEAPELERFRYIDMFKKLAEVAAEHGILIMMANHRLNPKAWPGDGLWFDAKTTELWLCDISTTST